MLTEMHSEVGLILTLWFHWLQSSLIFAVLHHTPSDFGLGQSIRILRDLLTKALVLTDSFQVSVPHIRELWHLCRPESTSSRPPFIFT